jgi:hypothetical protein
VPRHRSPASLGSPELRIVLVRSRTPHPAPPLRQSPTGPICPIPSVTVSLDAPPTCTSSHPPTTTRQLALTACALERHYLAHGAYPDSLAALVPTYLPAVPLDIINGDPLRYRRNDNGTFTLYSVGLDGDDDNGRRAPNRTDLDADGDWSW